jgi:RNA polymerase sigma-70 factor (ECF subfamily)
MECTLAAMAGDLRALQRLVESIAPRVHAVVRLTMGSGHPDADDVTQQSLIAFVQALPTFRAECEPGRFASRIAVRTAIAARRRKRSRQAFFDDMIDPDTLSCAESDRAIDKQRKQIIRDLLEQLPEEQAESLALRVMLGWSLDQVAVATGAPLNTVRSRLRLAKEALRRRIEADPHLRDALEVEP